MSRRATRVAPPVPGRGGAWFVGSVHSGYASGPYISRLVADAILGREPALPLFPSID